MAGRQHLESLKDVEEAKRTFLEVRIEEKRRLGQDDAKDRAQLEEIQREIRRLEAALETSAK